MREPCTNDCLEPSNFPKSIFNRPGLDKINYRIGQYTDFNEALKRTLNLTPGLSSFTYRGPDDPGIALMEGTALLGDILTFYQNLYANEAYLRTATWRESIAELVRMLGYRLTPGTGGKGTFAFEVKGSKPIIVPKDFAVKVQLDKMDDPSDFQTIQSITAYPHLSKFTLFRQQDQPDFDANTDEFYLDGTIAGLENVTLEVGDKLIIAEPELSNDGLPRVKKAETVFIDEVKEVHGVKTYKLAAPLTKPIDRASFVAYKVKETYNHFGHNAPPQAVADPAVADPAVDPDPTKLYSQYSTEKMYKRPTNSSTYGLVSPWLTDKDYPLDAVVDDLTDGTTLIIECEPELRLVVNSVGDFIDFVDDFVITEDYSYPLPRDYYVREVKKFRKMNLRWGKMSGSSTIITLDKDLHRNWRNSLDIRNVQIHVIEGPVLTVRKTPRTGTETTGKQLVYYGTQAEADALTNRRLFLQKGETEANEVSADAVTAQTGSFGRLANAWDVRLLQDVTYADFPHQTNDDDEYPITVYGNLADTTQGKEEKEAVLGNGDSRQTFQTFILPKIPLTYLNDSSSTPPQVPEVRVYVNDIQWTHVSSLFGHKADEQIYIIREDEDGKSWVQFGDGKTGAKLPSGVKNIKAIYRTGNNANGLIKEDAKAQATDKLDKLDKVYFPGKASMGAEAETGKTARETAPGKVQSLDRLVALKDYETEALSLSGVVKASAAWGLHDNVPLVKIYVLMDIGKYAKLEDIRTLLDAANRDRGLNRFPLKVFAGRFQYVRINIEVETDPKYKQDDIKKAIKTALGVVGEEANDIDGSNGLFGINQRLFGRSEYANNVLGVVQNIKGVVKVGLKYFHSMGRPDYPETSNSLNTLTDRLKEIPAQEEDVLALYKDHLQINLIEAKQEA